MHSDAQGTPSSNSGLLESLTDLVSHYSGKYSGKSESSKGSDSDSTNDIIKNIRDIMYPENGLYPSHSNPTPFKKLFPNTEERTSLDGRNIDATSLNLEAVHSEEKEITENVENFNNNQSINQPNLVVSLKFSRDSSAFVKSCDYPLGAKVNSSLRRTDAEKSLERTPGSVDSISAETGSQSASNNTRDLDASTHSANTPCGKEVARYFRYDKFPDDSGSDEDNPNVPSFSEFVLSKIKIFADRLIELAKYFGTCLSPAKEFVTKYWKGLQQYCDISMNGWLYTYGDDRKNSESMDAADKASYGNRRQDKDKTLSPKKKTDHLGHELAQNPNNNWQRQG